eukprot:TRINITY_DN29052_c0_g1_i1.p1 TRINITY_DN29052_c0_g1~~TRINITY_DN29052_c0_g1_i1.p1  ORF type:complete len:481 (+),score=53.21 TRINITY_DN29052_c0_g1_i1:158-1444(+)
MASTTSTASTELLGWSPKSSTSSSRTGSEKCIRGAPGRLATATNITGSILGAGILAVPYCYQLVGWSAGLVIVAAGAITSYTAMLIVHCLETAVSRVPMEEQQSDSCDWPLIGYAAFGWLGQVAVQAVFMAEMWFVLMAFLVVNGANLHLLIPSVPRPALIASSGLVAFASLHVPVRVLAWFSGMGHIAMATAFALLLATGIHNHLHGDTPEWSSYRWFHAPGLSQVVGIAIFCSVCHGALPTLYRTCGCKSRFSLLSVVSFALCALIYVFVGFLGYALFGDATEENIMGNIGRDLTGASIPVLGSFGRVASASLVIKLQSKFPIYAMSIVSAVEARGGIAKRLARVFVMAVTTVMAIYLREHMASCMALTGSLLQMCTAVTFPSLFYFKLHRETLSYGHCALLAMVFASGLWFQVTGTIDSIRKIAF